MIMNMNMNMNMVERPITTNEDEIVKTYIILYLVRKSGEAQWRALH